MERWTISFWVLLPLTQNESNAEKVLVQNIHGSGAYVSVDETGSKLFSICEETDKRVEANIDLKK